MIVPLAVFAYLAIALAAAAIFIQLPQGFTRAESCLTGLLWPLALILLGIMAVFAIVRGLFR